MEVYKCKYIICPVLSIKHWFFILFLVGGFLRIFVPDVLIYFNNKKKGFGSENSQNEIEQNKDNIKYHLTNKYFEIMRNIASDLFLGVFHCYYKLRDSTEKKKKGRQTYTNNQRINFIFNDNTPSSSQMTKMIFIISLVDIICQLIIPIKYIIDYYWSNDHNILDTEPYHLYILLFFDIFARYFFSLWILRTYFYIHHYLSFLLNIIGLSFITIIDIRHKIIGSDNYNILFIILLCIQTILYSFEDIMNKVAFRTLYISPNTLIFYKGLVQLIYLAIISILFFIFYFDNEYFNMQFELQKFICFVPFNIIRTYFLVKVIDKFSAQHMALLRVSETIIIFFYGKIASLWDGFKENPFHEEYEIYEICVQIFGFMILLISTLIHNEIIIINHPKLRAKTEYYLDKDADREQQSSFDSNTFSESKDNTINSVTDLCSDITGSDMS
jgi:hypothetical protein